MSKKVLSGLLLTALLAGLFLVAHGAGTKIIIGQTAGPVGLDMYSDPAVPSESIAYNIIETLVITNYDLSELAYRLATSIESVDDVTWIIHLRQGVFWSDGVPFNAEDVVFTWDLLRREGATYKHKVPAVVTYQATALDTYTVKIVTQYPYANFLRRLIEVPILAKHVVEKIGMPEHSRAPVGTGPFKLVEWVKDDHVTLEANDLWWGGTPMYDEVVFRFIPDATTRLADLLAGTIDLMAELSPDLIPVVERTPGLDVTTVPGLRCMALFMNPYVKPLDDVRVRQAICYAIDRNVLIDDVLGGLAVPSYAQLGPGDVGYTLLGINRFDYDPVKAKELLVAAGYADGFEIESQLGRRFLKDMELVQVMQDQLAQVGIRIKILPMEWGTFYSQYYPTGKMTISFYGFANMMGDGDLALFYLYHSKGQGQYYHNPQLDEVIDAQAAELDAPIREQLLNSILREVTNNAAACNLFKYQDIWGHKEGLKWFPRVDMRVLLFEL